jgi:hypothetical protein
MYQVFFIVVILFCSNEKETEPVPQGLSRWRSVVRSALSAAQLTLCCNQLNKCIAWEKSIMKVVSESVKSSCMNC